MLHVFAKFFSSGRTQVFPESNSVQVRTVHAGRCVRRNCVRVKQSVLLFSLRNEIERTMNFERGRECAIGSRKESKELHNDIIIRVWR